MGDLRMNTRTTLHRTGIAILIASLAGTAVAAEPNTEDAGLLGGPEIVETSGPDSGDTMSGSSDASRKAGDMPLRAYIGAVMSLRKDAKENPELALTEEQQESIKAISRAHAEKMRAFKEEHKEEFSAMRGAQGEAGERGQRGERGARGERGERGQRGEEAGERGERPSPEEMQRNREKLSQLMSKAPSDQEAKKELWAVLTPAQQTAVKERVSKMRTQREDRVDRAMEAGQADKQDGESKRKQMDGKRVGKERMNKERQGKGKRGKEDIQEIDD
jgi:hypothetical protein